MIYLGVPARNDLPWYVFKSTLSGILYTLEFRYNPRMQRWILNINDAVGNVIIAGIPLLILRDLTSQYSTYDIPEGLLFCLDNTNKGDQPSRYSFGTTHSLIYGDPTQS